MPEDNEWADVEAINENMKKIDEELAKSLKAENITAEDIKGLGFSNTQEFINYLVSEVLLRATQNDVNNILNGNLKVGQAQFADGMRTLSADVLGGNSHGNSWILEAKHQYYDGAGINDFGLYVRNDHNDKTSATLGITVRNATEANGHIITNPVRISETAPADTSALWAW